MTTQIKAGDSVKVVTGYTKSNHEKVPKGTVFVVTSLESNSKAHSGMRVHGVSTSGVSYRCCFSLVEVSTPAPKQPEQDPMLGKITRVYGSAFVDGCIVTDFAGLQLHDKLDKADTERRLRESDEERVYVLQVIEVAQKPPVPPKQSVAELVAENASIFAQVERMRNRIERKLDYVAENNQAIRAQGGYV